VGNFKKRSYTEGLEIGGGIYTDYIKILIVKKIVLRVTTNWRITTLWDKMPCILENFKTVLDKRTASTSMVKDKQ
jgi:hypothetical protein